MHFHYFFSFIFYEKSLLKFSLFIILGLSFSLTVVLSAIGVMNGFEKTLRGALRSSMGDIYFTSPSGFFSLNADLRKKIHSLNFSQILPVIQLESFLKTSQEATGVLLQGIEGLKEEGIQVGLPLAEKLRLKVSDRVSLSFAGVSKDLSGMPTLKSFPIESIYSNGIYQKDLRIVYLPLERMQEILETSGKVNMVSLKVALDFKGSIDDLAIKLQTLLGPNYKVRTYWMEFATLLEAVSIEKMSITVVLQTIVIIAIFNILAFIVFLSEHYSREIFLFQALGLSKKRLKAYFYSFALVLWFLSSGPSLFLIFVIDYLLKNLSYFEIPGDVYQVTRLHLDIGLGDFLLVFLSALIWILILLTILFFKLKKRPILYGLKKEFT